MSYLKGLFINECVKRKKRMLWIVIVYFIFVATLLVAEWSSRSSNTPMQDENWRTQLEMTIGQLSAQTQMLDSNDQKRIQLENQLAIAQYQLNENIHPQPKGALHWSNSDLSGMTIKYFIPLIIIIIGADLLAAEVSSGTMKLLLLSPAGRIRIFLGKLIFLCSVSFALTLFIHFTSFIVGLIKDKQLGLFDSYVLINHTGELFTMKSWLFAITGISLNFLSVMVIASLVLLISLIFSSSPTFAVLLSFLTVLILDSLLMLLRDMTTLVDYYPLFHIDLVSHFQGFFTGTLNITGSILIVILYSVLFIFSGSILIKRRAFTA